MRHLTEVRAYIAAQDPGAATRVLARISEAIDGLLPHPERGRPGRLEGTRELVITGTPYLVPYRINGEVIEILAILHGARAWPRSDL